MRWWPVFVLLAVLVMLPVPAGALERPTDVTTSELASAQSGLDGQPVRWSGEVISERLRGGADHVWLNVLSDGVAIGVWMPREMAAEVEVFGDWQHTGDKVEVTGVYNEACNQHGGDLDVHATELRVVRAGVERTHALGWWKLAVALVGVLVAYYGYRRLQRVEEGDLHE